MPRELSPGAGRPDTLRKLSRGRDLGAMREAAGEPSISRAPDAAGGAAAGAATEHFDVLIIGAGLSGIDAAYRVQSQNPTARYAVLEARDATGGTWDLFRYPGIRSDSDMTTLGFPFRPWRHENAIAGGDAIRAYIQDTASHYGIDQHIRLNHRVASADWSSVDRVWTVTVERPDGRLTLTCAFLFFCAGYYDYRQGHAPAWPGLDTFEGDVLHPQFWPDATVIAGRRIAVIGSGATAITLIPALVERGAEHVTMVQRSPTYIISRPSKDVAGARLRRWLPARAADAVIRWKNITLSRYFYDLARRKPAHVKRLIAEGQQKALGPAFDMAHLTPRYDPWDQRLCVAPEGDFFKALKSGSADIVTDTIEAVCPDGLVLGSGDRLKADIIVTATGLKLQLMGGARLSIDGQAIEPSDRLLYRGAMLDGVPNFAFALGYTNASWTLRCDLSAQYVGRLIAHMRRRGWSVATPTARSQDRSEDPMLDLQAGYVQRSAGLLPRQGRRAPWRVVQNYAVDRRSLKSSPLEDSVLQFQP